MNIESNKSLRSYNSFGFEISAEWFTSVNTLEQLREALHWARTTDKTTLILGGGSNTLFTRNVDGLVIHIAIPGFETTVTDDQESTLIRVGAGMNWHDLVATTLHQKLYGLENLALIPGSAGAAPIQNIGAYGVELSELLTEVEVLNTRTGESDKLNNSDCDFGYRHSTFKTPVGKNFVVTAIHIKLSNRNRPKIEYKALQDILEQQNITQPDCQQVFNSVCDIRRSKLPDPAYLGNAGSFFKNPVITRQQLDTLLVDHSDLPNFFQDDGTYKVPAAWLIDRAGWKGHRNGAVGVHSEQALVLVNHGDGNGQQIAILANEIRNDILQRFNIALEREPVIY